ncbi:MAG: PQQ-dependent sugar dehydrogenase, partial [Pseudomonadota bacterium]|nr:PQQ-dependent sugar dehydrogenase [Pseudomonadota bacterium]
LFVGALSPAYAQTSASVIADNLNHPWSVAFLPGGDFLVTERRGNLLRISPSGEKTEISGVPDVVTGGQAGLFDVVLSPDFARDSFVYLSYAGEGEDGSNTEVAHARLDLDTNALTDFQVIFRAEPKVSGKNHYGGRLLFTPDGTLFITLGDRYEYRDEAQNPENHLGKIVRLKDGKTEIYSRGHRNVQGIALQPGTVRIWTHEHGARGGDEVNILKPGANYGWPLVTYGVDYSGAIISSRQTAPGIEPPVVYWTPSIAPSGMAFYTGDSFPAWKGDLFVGALAGQHLRRLDVEGDRIVGQEVLLEGLGQRIRDVRMGPDGYLYILTDEDNGQLVRLREP